MKRMTKHIGVLLTALLAGGALTSCQNDFDAPGMNIPVASLQPNTTIAELKSDYWNDADNYIDEISLFENGEHKIIAGRVVSSDASGNIYKNLVIQDETGALTMSINANSLYNNYRIGQEIVVDVTEMYIGKYSTLQQLGFPEYSPAYGWQATFMPLEFFKQHIQLNGLPEPSKVDTLTINLGELGTDAANMQKYQSRLVRINNVKFEEGGEASFCTAHKVNTNRTLKDANGNTLIVRTSGYANYWSAKLPAENGDVVGILSTYKSGGTLQWQLLMRSTDDLLNFGNPTLPKGTEDNPYDIAEAIAMTNSSSAVSGWFTGYIVGSVKGGTEAVTTDEDILWGDEAEVASNLVIGQTPEATSLSECVLLSLPQGSPLREYGNLRDTKENYKKQIWVLATPGEELGMPALTKNNGAANTWRIEGVDVPGESLSHVVIVKMPFPVPSDPVFQARSENIDKNGGKSFMELSVPESVIKFKQGFGRLMRSCKDRGCVTVLDNRLISKYYGKFFLESVPKSKNCFNTLENVVLSIEKFLADV